MTETTPLNDESPFLLLGCRMSFRVAQQAIRLARLRFFATVGADALVESPVWRIRALVSFCAQRRFRLFSPFLDFPRQISIELDCRIE